MTTVTIEQVIKIAEKEGISPSGYCRNVPPSSYFGGPPDTPKDWLSAQETSWLDQIARSQAWIRSRSRNKRISPKTGSSYGLKHDVERATGNYVSNGAFLIACILEGVALERIKDGSRNAWTNISRKAASGAEPE